jgi:predicted amidophosphoribosyltransferase
VKKRAKVCEKRILLIDDVFTTGATVQECAKILLKAGAKQVDVLTLARVL